jgi:serine/threonine protein kinase
MAKRLLVLAGPDEGKVFPLNPGEALLLGRSRATEGRLIDPHVSRVHCQVQTEGAQATITDFDSAGGTVVNGKKIAGKQELKPGDLVRIGNTRLQYFADETAAAEPETPMAIPAKRASTAVSWAAGLVGEKMSNYKVGPILARGRSGYVFHARDITKNVPVALKVLDPRFGKNNVAVQRFVRAMKTVMPLRHPNVVTVYSAGKTGPYCWIAMEYVPGESLAAVIGRIETGGTLDWRHVLRFAVYMARALDYSHKKKIIHRNINPKNILLGNNAVETKLTDLMLAKAIEGDTGDELAKTAEILGDFPYLSPEATAGGAQEVDGRSDIYSLGATIYAMLSGQPPFTGETVTELAIKILREPPPPLKTLLLGSPPEFESLVEKMMAKKPADRFASATKLVQELELLAKAKGVAV